MKRLLVVLPNWFGETLFATPFLRALREGLPNSYLATLGWPQCREMLLDNPRVDCLLDYDEHGRHRSLAGKWRLIQAIRRMDFDAAFILRKSLSRSMLLWLARIPARIGFAHRKSGWLLTRHVPPSADGIHKAATYLPLLEAVGLARPPLLSYEYYVSLEERQAAAALLPHVQSGETRPLVVLHPGANWPHKRWPTDRFAALADRLIASHGAQVVITGGPDDRPLAEAIQQRMRQPPTLLAGRTTLRALAACLECAQLIIAADTGVLHMACALHRPVVALYGPTSPALTGPLGDPKRIVVIHHPDCCPTIPCYQPDQPLHPGMEAIAVEEVYRAAEALLAQRVGA